MQLFSTDSACSGRTEATGCLLTPPGISQITGRAGGLVREGDKVVYRRRKVAEAARNKANLVEREAFNRGRKLVAVISEAASVGGGVLF